MEGDALVKQLTGAEVEVMAEDVPGVKKLMPGGKEHPIDKILRSFAIVCAEGAGPEPGGPLPGMSFWHFAVAARNAGAAGLFPTGTRTTPLSGVGSGKVGTPLARMHLANSSAIGPPVPAAVVRELVLSPPVAALDPAVILEPGLDSELAGLPTVAAAGPGEPCRASRASGPR